MGLAPAKGLSLGSAATLRIERHPHDYRWHGNRELVLDSGTTWVKLWLSWFDLQALGAPAGRAESWEELNFAPGDLPGCPPFSDEPALRNLDRQIAAANADGIRVIVAIDECMPEWATRPGVARLQPSLEHYLQRPTGGRPPLDCSPNGPWGWLIEHLSARYHRGAPRNPTGPHEPREGERCVGYDPRVGNPDGAVIDAIEILHEPNLRWPESGAPLAAAEMVRTACDIASLYGGPAILAPSLSDLREEQLVGEWGAGTPLSLFAELLLRELRGFQPSVYLAWSQHNYGDVAFVNCAGVTAASDMLADIGPGWNGGREPAIWLTECAFPIFDPRTLTIEDGLEQERLQAETLTRNFARISEYPEVRLWTHQTIHDLETSSVRLGLREEFDYERGEPGPERIALEHFYALAGTDASVSELDDGLGAVGAA